ncbi:MAG TPA: hypothetical protein VMG12_38350 [Polyangiaceae bacterium]|nr:hypothetical protein [Polyangiaceae bacterium]
MNDPHDEMIRRRLLDYRAATDAAEAPAALLAQLERDIPRRSRQRRFARDARAGLVIAALAGGGSGLWAHLDRERCERELYVQVAAWAEAP